MNYNEALEYIHSVMWMGSRPGLPRTEQLLRLLGNPERDMKFIHVAGTNGKGSTCSMLDSVLRAAGYKVGLYTSPYIVSFNERMCIDGNPISDYELAELTSIVKPFADGMQDKPTEFELITAIAFLYYKKHACDVVVLEVGMGGALDSTNVIESPVVSVITGIALDHTSVLGSTVSEIAAQKAGIIKNTRPVVYGGRDDTAFSVISETANAKSSPCVRTKPDEVRVHSIDITGTTFDYGVYSGLKLSLLGKYQLDNVATVLETVDQLNANGFDISEESVRNGLASAKWRARFELLDTDPCVIFDGSHNIQGVTAAAESIKTFFKEKVILLMGVLADKDYRDMVSILSPLVNEVYTVTPDSPRALKSDDLASVFGEFGIKSTPFDDIESGVAEAYVKAKTQNMPLIMLGSLYMYGDVFKAFEKAKK